MDRPTTDYSKGIPESPEDWEWRQYADHLEARELGFIQSLRELETEKRAAEAEAGKQICRNTELEAENERLREAAKEAKELLWEMQSVQPYSDNIHYVGGRLKAALEENRS